MPTLYMAWRSVEHDELLYWAVSFDGKWWSPQQVLSDRSSLSAPALAVFKDQLFMAWRGDGDDNLWWATYDGNAELKWSNQSPLRDRGSALGPALGVFQDRLYMAWRGVQDAGHDDDILYWAAYDPENPFRWTPQRPLGDRASQAEPALAAFQGQFFMAWRGVTGDENLYWATFDPNDPRGWTDQHRLDDRASAEGPALAVFQNKLYMVWRGVGGLDSDDSLYWATYDENNPRKWTDQTVMATVAADPAGPIVVGSVKRPSVAAFRNSLFVAGVGFNIHSTTGLPEPGASQGLGTGNDPNQQPQGPDPDVGAQPPPLEPKGLCYVPFDGNKPTLPVMVFTNRASEAAVAEAVFHSIPLSLRTLMLKHGFDPSQGINAFLREFSPGARRPLPLRPLVGF